MQEATNQQVTDFMRQTSRDLGAFILWFRSLTKDRQEAGTLVVHALQTKINEVMMEVRNMPESEITNEWLTARHEDIRNSALEVKKDIEALAPLE